jgi:hypothetical protein
MAGSFRSSLLAVLLLPGALACVDSARGIEGTTSFVVEILSPADLGAADRRLPPTDRTVMLRVTAKDAHNEVDVGYAGAVDVYTHFLGTLTPDHDGTPPDLTMLLADGVGTASLTLPNAFGPTYLWVEDVRGTDERGPTFATGTSATIWYRDPFLDDVSRPNDETALDALERSPLEGKQVKIETSKAGVQGALIVTGVYSQGYTLSDVDCSTLPCASTPYGHVFVFTFNRPRAESTMPGVSGKAIEIGDDIMWVSGGVGEFNGFTELNFPQSTLIDETPDESRLPAPVTLDGAWLANQQAMVNLEQNESGLVEIVNGRVCPVDEDFTTYSQWKLDVGNGCGRPYNIISAGVVASFDPTQHTDQVIPRVVGTLRAVNIGTFHVWIIYPRRDGDIVL